LKDYNQLFQEGKNCIATHFKNSIKDTEENLITKFEHLEEKGKTALGPALIASLGLLSESKPGSILIMCTDGLAN
jgi:hypothetical protein